MIYPLFYVVGDVHLRLRHNVNPDLDYRGIQPLDVSIRALEAALQDAEKTDKPVYLAGDLFDRANFNHVETTAVITLLKKYSSVTVFCIRGNHDTSAVHTWKKVYPFNHILHVVEKACSNFSIVHTADTEGVLTKQVYAVPSNDSIIRQLVYTLPYMESDTSFIEALKDILEDADIYKSKVQDDNKGREVEILPCLICHQSISPLVPDVIVEQHHFKGFSWVWNGHIHGKSFLGNPTNSRSEKIRILGSLTYQTLKDKDLANQKGYYLCGVQVKGKRNKVSIYECFKEVNVPKIVELTEGTTPHNDTDYIQWIRPITSYEQSVENAGAGIDDSTHEGKESLIVDYVRSIGGNANTVIDTLLPLLKETTKGVTSDEQVSLEFTELRLEGFLSWAGESVYKLNYPYKTHITGPEGSGKSNLFKAFIWCLCGKYWNRSKSFSNPVSYPEYRNQVEGFKGCKVESDFIRNGTPYTLIRTAGRYKGKVYGENLPNGLMLINRVTGEAENLDTFILGFEEISQTLKRNTAKVLSFLGLTLNDLKYTLCLRPEYTDLISADQSEARKLFDSMVGADWIDELKIAVEDKLSLVTIEEQRCAALLAQSEEHRDRLESSLEEAKEALELKKKEKQTLIESQTTLVDKYDQSVKALTVQLDEAKTKVKILQKEAPVVEDLDELKIELRTATITIQSLENTLATATELQGKITELKKDLDTAKAEYVAYLEKKTAEDAALNELRNQLKVLSNQLSTLGSIESIQGRLTESEGVKQTALRSRLSLDLEMKKLTDALENDKKQLRDLVEGKVTCVSCGQNLPKKTLEDREAELLLTIGEQTASLAAKKAQLEVLALREDTADQEYADIKQSEKSFNEHTLELQQLEGTIRLKEKSLYIVQSRCTSKENQIKEYGSKIKQLTILLNDERDKDYDPIKKQLTKSKSRVSVIQQLLNDYENQITLRQQYIEKTLKPAEALVNDINTRLQTASKNYQYTVATRNASVSELEQLESGDSYAYLESSYEDAEQAYLLSKTNFDNAISKKETYTFLKSKVVNPKGLKPFVIGRKLSKINFYCKKYASVVNASLRVEVDDKSNYAFILSFDGVDRDGATLSTGWTFHANMSLLGALIKNRETRVKTNILFLDEPFATIPLKSTEAVYRMITAITEDNPTHIITHSQVKELTFSREVKVTGGVVNGKEVPSEFITS